MPTCTVSSNEIDVNSGEAVVVDVNGADDRVYISLNDQCLYLGGNFNSNISDTLKPGNNLLVISLYNDNRKHKTGQSANPSSMNGTLSVRNQTYNLSYNSGGPIDPGIVRQYLFLISKG